MKSFIIMVFSSLCVILIVNATAKENPVYKDLSHDPHAFLFRSDNPLKQIREKLTWCLNKRGISVEKRKIKEGG